jgi:hypothetical protein
LRNHSEKNRRFPNGVEILCIRGYIIALGTVGVFVLAMDVLNYGFGIDPAGEELRRASMRTRQKRSKSIVAIQFLYGNASAGVREVALISA